MMPHPFVVVPSATTENGVKGLSDHLRSTRQSIATAHKKVMADRQGVRRAGSGLRPAADFESVHFAGFSVREPAQVMKWLAFRFNAIASPKCHIWSASRVPSLNHYRSEYYRLRPLRTCSTTSNKSESFHKGSPRLSHSSLGLIENRFLRSMFGRMWTGKHPQKTSGIAPRRVD